MSESSSLSLGATARNEHVRGLLLVFVAGVLYSSAGVFTRGLALDGWTLVAWRSLSGAAFTMLLVAIENRRVSLRDYAVDRTHAILVPIGAAATISYIFALKLTTVADVMIVYATTPFVTALVAWIWIREVPSRRMLLASTAALLGVAIMIAGGPASGGRLLGTALILFMNVSFALFLVLARRSPGQSMTPVNALSLLLASVVSFAMAPVQVLGVATVLDLLLFGLLTVGFAMSLFMVGARVAPASEVALIGISDVVIGPLMVWLLFGENPGVAAVIGGGIVALSLVWNVWPEVVRLVERRRLGVEPH